MKTIKNYLQFIKEEFYPNTTEQISNELSKINSMIDYTLLEESSTKEDILELCKKADQLGVKSVCVLPKMVKVASEALKDSKVLVCTVVSFPHGTDTPEQKLNETSKAVYDGADEVDMVLNYPLLQGKSEKEILEGGSDSIYEKLWNQDVQPLSDYCHDHKNKDGENVILKVIVESGLLTEEETKLATDICLEAGADFIKTSTGKVLQGAELNKIKVMYDTIKEAGSNMKIKASGGVRDMSQINQFMPFVDRFGMGYGSVDKINNLTSGGNSTY